MEKVVSWLLTDRRPVNTQFEQRVVNREAPDVWQATQVNGLEVRVLEYVPGAGGRLAALFRQQDPDHQLHMPVRPGTEFFVMQGDVQIGESDWPAGLYVRQPALPEGTEAPAQLALCAALQSAGSASDRRAMVYLTVGHLSESDTEQRTINTGDQERWLPGPVDGTEVLPLHGHGTSNAMLLRWHTEVAFRPRLDPLGEEVLVLRGTLHDAEGDYPPGTWIRNPVASWQSWGGECDTVVLYKSGHFEITASA